MTAQAIIWLGELLREYMESPQEFEELSEVYGVEIPSWHGRDPWTMFARFLMENLEHGTTRLFLEGVLEQVEVRNSRGIAGSRFERLQHHQLLEGHLARLKAAVGDPAIPQEILVADGRRFSAKSEVREFLSQAETEILIVDPYIGVGTLDCLRDVSHPVRLLTGTRDQSVGPGFDRAYREFRAEGGDLEVKRHEGLHDRHIAFNDRCWLVGSSLKDAGAKAFHVIEVRDVKDAVVASLEEKWEEGQAMPEPTD